MASAEMLRSNPYFLPIPNSASEGPPLQAIGATPAPPRLSVASSVPSIALVATPAPRVTLRACCVMRQEEFHPDGKVERSYGSGRAEILYSNGTRKDVHPNGVQTVVFANGDIKQTGVDRSASAAWGTQRGRARV